MKTTKTPKQNAADLLAQLGSMPTKPLMGLYHQLIKKGAPRKNRESLLKALRPVLEGLAGAEEKPAAEADTKAVGKRLGQRMAARATKDEVMDDSPASDRKFLKGFEAPKAARKGKTRGAQIAEAQAAAEPGNDASDPDIKRALAEEEAILAERVAAGALTKEEAEYIAAAEAPTGGIDAAAAQAEEIVGSDAGPGRCTGRPGLHHGADETCPRCRPAPAQPVSLRALIDAALAEATTEGAGGVVPTTARDALYEAGRVLVEENIRLAAGKPARAPRAPKAPAAPRAPKARDPRLPPVGTILERDTRSHGLCQVQIVENGVAYKGATYGSLSKAASVHMGVNQNGYLFFAKALAELGAGAGA
jgi:hypothetical protein